MNQPHLEPTFVDVFDVEGNHKGNRWVSGDCQQRDCHQNCNKNYCQCPCHSPSENLYTATMMTGGEVDRVPFDSQINLEMD
jgi:hypothetical protein